MFLSPPRTKKEQNQKRTKKSITNEMGLPLVGSAVEVALGYMRNLRWVTFQAIVEVLIAPHSTTMEYYFENATIVGSFC